MSHDNLIIPKAPWNHLKLMICSEVIKITNILMRFGVAYEMTVMKLIMWHIFTFPLMF